MKSGESGIKGEADQEQLSSSDAMDEYFFDMLGSVADQQPLKKCEESDGMSFHSSTTERNPLSLLNEPSLPSPKLKPKEKVIAKVEFAEPVRTKISSLIIPAAFPKLAPVEVKPETQTKTEETLKVEESIKTTQKDKIELKAASKLSTKLDRKTALAILEKKSSQLSAVQLERLEVKLGVKTQQITETTVDVQVETKVETKQEKKIDVKPETKVKTVEAKPQTVQQQTVEKASAEEASITPGQPGLIGPPAWAEDRFECLIFTVAGLKLAVPLVSLGGVYKMESELTPIVGRADYFMGLYRHLDRNVSVLDTAQWVMPDRWTESVRADYSFIIRLGGGNWGLACDAVHESIQLESDMVKWRSERTSRAWLSGTVIGHMCALLDVDVLNSMLEEKMSSNGSLFS